MSNSKQSYPNKIKQMLNLNRSLRKRIDEDRLIPMSCLLHKVEADYCFVDRLEKIIEKIEEYNENNEIMARENLKEKLNNYKEYLEDIIDLFKEYAIDDIIDEYRNLQENVRDYTDHLVEILEQ